MYRLLQTVLKALCSGSASPSHILRNEPHWISAETAIEYNERLVAASGEHHFLRDRGLLESACARPLNLWAYNHEQDVCRLAASLGIGIARNHPFEQGNKRTGFVCAIDFI